VRVPMSLPTSTKFPHHFAKGVFDHFFLSWGILDLQRNHVAGLGSVRSNPGRGPGLACAL
jgi:hypothetical protein